MAKNLSGSVQSKYLLRLRFQAEVLFIVALVVWSGVYLLLICYLQKAHLPDQLGCFCFLFFWGGLGEFLLFVEKLTYSLFFAVSNIFF